MRWIFLLAVGAISLSAADNRWEPNIASYEKRDRAQPPLQGEIVFVGSSTIAGWDVGKFLPGLPILNRGFGGSQTSDSAYYAERIILPYRPRVVVFYAGDNDIASGKSPAQVASDTAELHTRIREALPRTRFVYLGIKPCGSRWADRGKQLEAVRLIGKVLAGDPLAVVLDLDQVAIGPDHKPNAAMFLPDALHFSAAGYTALSALVRPYLDYDPAVPHAAP